MKYKVGDKVRVREDLVHGEKYDGISFYMDGWKDKIVTISFVGSDYYEIAEDEDKWCWTDEMFEDIVENKKYKIGDKVKIREDLVADEEYGEIDYISDMDKWKGKVVTISFADNDNNCYGIAEDTELWTWSAEMFEDVPDEVDNNMNEGDTTLFGELESKGMTIADLLNKTNVETGGLIIAIYSPKANFEVTMGHNYINRESELYKRFIGAYGDMIVDEITFRIEDGHGVIAIKVE